MTKQLKTKHERENKYQTWTVKQLSPPSKKEKKGKRVSKVYIGIPLSLFPLSTIRSGARGTWLEHWPLSPVPSLEVVPLPSRPVGDVCTRPHSLPLLLALRVCRALCLCEQGVM